MEKSLFSKTIKEALTKKNLLSVDFFDLIVIFGLIIFLLSGLVK